jgi:hypothetical protein
MVGQHGDCAVAVISAEQWQLTSFFEVVPTYPYPDSPWPYTEVIFEVERGDLSLRCAIAPAYRDVRLIIRCGESLTYQLNATQVEDVAYNSDSTGESLRIVLSESEHIELRMKPAIAVSHSVDQQFMNG